MDPLDLIKQGKIKRYFRPARNASQREAGGATRKRENGVRTIGGKVGKFEDLEVWKEGMRLGGWRFDEGAVIGYETKKNNKAEIGSFCAFN